MLDLQYSSNQLGDQPDEYTLVKTIGMRRTNDFTTEPRMLNAFVRTESISKRVPFCRKASCTFESRTLHVQILKETVA
jgi:hypothetical protein